MKLVFDLRCHYCAKYQVWEYIVYRPKIQCSVYNLGQFKALPSAHILCLFVGSLYLSIAPSSSVLTVDINQWCLKWGMTQPFLGEKRVREGRKESLSTRADSCCTRTSTHAWKTDFDVSPQSWTLQQESHTHTNISIKKLMCKTVFRHDTSVECLIHFS